MFWNGIGDESALPALFLFFGDDFFQVGNLVGVVLADAEALSALGGGAVGWSAFGGAEVSGGMDWRLNGYEGCADLGGRGRGNGVVNGGATAGFWGSRVLILEHSPQVADSGAHGCRIDEKSSVRESARVVEEEQEEEGRSGGRGPSATCEMMLRSDAC